MEDIAKEKITAQKGYLFVASIEVMLANQSTNLIDKDKLSIYKISQTACKQDVIESEKRIKNLLKECRDFNLLVHIFCAQGMNCIPEVIKLNILESSENPNWEKITALYKNLLIVKTKEILDWIEEDCDARSGQEIEEYVEKQKKRRGFFRFV
jgi:hypothetical protein